MNAKTKELGPSRISKELSLLGFGDGRAKTLSQPLRDALKRFQAAADLPTTGEPTKAVQDILAKRPRLKQGDESVHVLRLQHLLNGRGFRLPVSGVFDVNTRNALVEYQGRLSLPRDGVTSAAVWKALEQ